VRICYLDESGTPELQGGTSHFVLVGLSIQGETWKAKDAEVTAIKRRFGLEREEIHTNRGSPSGRRCACRICEEH
jgi:hypothetical protein